MWDVRCPQLVSTHSCCKRDKAPYNKPSEDSKKCALSHLTGLPMIAGAAMGIGAMAVVMLGLPLTSVLLVAIFLPADAVNLTPLVIVAVVVAYVANARLTPPEPETGDVEHERADGNRQAASEDRDIRA
jgi:hypothetical protein